VPKKGAWLLLKIKEWINPPKEPSLGGGCVLIIKNLTKQQRKIIFRCPSLIKYWSDWQITISSTFLMGIRVVTRYRSI
jgi:hypothetical protein